MFFCLLLPSVSSGKVYSLKDAILVAFKKNPRIKRYTSLKESKLADVYLTLSEFAPSVFLELTYNRYFEEYGVQPQIVEDYSFGVRFMWNIFSGFSSLNRLKESERLLEASQQNVRKAFLDVAMDVVNAYIDYLKAKAMLSAAEADLREAKINYRLVKKRYEVGLAPRADLYSAEADVANAKFTLVDRKAKVLKARGALAVVMGLSVVEKIDVLEPEIELTTLDLNAAIRQAFEKRPEVLAAFKEVEAQKKKVASVKGEFLPSVDFSGAYYKHDESLFPDDRKEWNIQVKVSFPIFTGLSTHSKLKKEKALLAEKRFYLEEVKLQVQKEVWFSYQDLNKAKEEFIAAKELFKAAQEELKVTRGKYMRGLASTVDLTVSQAKLSDARAKYVSSKYELYRAYYTFVKTIGYIPGIER